MIERERSACPICEGTETVFFLSVDGVDYRRCGLCKGTFMEYRYLPEKDFERERYLLHDNDPDDSAYRRFLARLAEPLLERLPPGLRGLDYGCGPGPALAAMMEEAGHAMRLYDPFFYPDLSVLADTYDFITCTEVAEHFHNPAEEFRKLDALLRPGGLLALMTSFQEDDGAFARWHYRREPTHVVFYRAETFQCLAGRHGWTCEIPIKDVVFFQKL